MHEGVAATVVPQTTQPGRTHRGLLRATAGLVCAAVLIGAAWPAPLSASAVLAWTGMRSSVADLAAHEAWTLTLFGIGMVIAGRTLRRRPAER